MRLVADRFAVDDEGGAVDLATGSPVELIVGPAGGVSDQRRWLLRCDALGHLHHGAVAPLLDFGVVGEASRFEAWQCGGPAKGRDAGAEATARAARAWLHACGLGVGENLHVRVGGKAALVALPDADTGYPLVPDYPDDDEMPLRQRGLASIARPALGGLAEMLDALPGSRPHVAALWGPPGSGKSLVVRALARTARANGFVPVSAALVNTALAALWNGRSVFVIADDTREGAWPALIHTVLRAARAHAMLLVGPTEVRGVDGIALDRVPVERLVDAIRPRIIGDRWSRTARRAAERAAGLPGRFARFIRPDGPESRCSVASLHRGSVPRAAEQAAAYGSERRAEDLPHLQLPPMGGIWPAPGELAALRRRVTGASGLLSRGQHQPAIRQLRQAVGGFARRDAWIDAGDAGMVLASALLRRGRVKDAQSVLEETRQYAGRSSREPLLLDIAAMNAEAWIDAARLDEAENVATAALTSARAAEDAMRARALSLVLARCLCWRGRWADAAATIGEPDADATIDTRVRHAALASRIAIGLQDVPRAMALVNEAIERTASDPGTAARAAADCAAALVHLAVDDFDAVERSVAGALAAARVHHDPLRAVRARLLLAEADRRRGRTARAVAVIGRIDRLSAALPVTVRARCSLITALAGAAADQLRSLVARHVAASGLHALALFAPRPPISPATGALPQVVDDLVGVLRLCQTAEDEATILKMVCARIRQQSHAASVAFIVTGARGALVLESDGARMESDIASRATDAGVTIGPHHRGDRIEAAAPVQYGGRPIAVLCARWAIGCTHDVSRAPVILTMGAAAAAPLVSAVLARREQTLPSAAGTIIGITPAAHELRSTVERVAPAPFAVLIDGESGCGKELVARALHRASPRRDRAFCTLNCAALPDDLVEAELFGHTRGAFTGAVADRAGVFEEAHGGTLFLDEVGELSARAQAKLLRVIQEGELRRVGENLSRRVDARLVAATNRNLQQEVAAGRFRLDLLYRLDVIRLTVPPLRDRREDILVLAEHFWRECAARVGSRAILSAAALGALARYDWPGNVRELQNVLASLAVRSPRRGVVPPEALPPHFGARAAGELFRLDEARRVFETGFVRAALARTGGRRARAAEELGVSRQGLTKLMTRLGIAAHDQRLATSD